MPNFKEYRDYDGIGLGQLIKDKQIQPIDALDSAIDLIEEYNPSLNFVHQKLYHYAMESINRNTDLSGTFAGVPMLLKDMDSALSTVPMMQGSKYLKNTKMTFNNSLSKITLYEAAIL